MSTEQRAPLPSDPSRRDFFKIGLVASAGLTVAALIPSALAAQGEPSKSAPCLNRTPLYASRKTTP